MIATEGQSRRPVRVWIDIDNPPQVQYLLPFCSVFERAGCEVVVTARDYGFALDLMRRSGVPFHAVGSSFGKSISKKVRGTWERSGSLVALFRELGRPDVVLGASRTAAVTARRLGIASFYIVDYEYAHTTMLRLTGSYLFHPDVIDPAVFIHHGIKPSRLIPFEGLKEDITFAETDIDAIEPHVFPDVSAETIKVLFRPPAEESHYYRSESRRIALAALEHLAQSDDVTVVFSPRARRQTEYLGHARWTRAPLLLSRPLPFVPLLKAVDLVISSGGTMLREAAYVGIPAYSIFKSEIGAVDHHLESLGRLTIIDSPADFERIALTKDGRRPVLRSNPDLIGEISETILEHVSAARHTSVRPWTPSRQAVARPRERVLLSSSRRSLFLDYFRVPYTLVPEPRAHGGGELERVTPVSGGGRVLFWPAESALRRVSAKRPRSYRLGTNPIFGRALTDDEAEQLLVTTGRSWRPALSLTDARGVHHAWVRKADDGSVFLPFDPDEAISTLWSERYGEIRSRHVARRAKRLMVRAYYVARPALPRHLQTALRRRFTRVQARAKFPDWPVESALHDLYAQLFALLGDVAGEPVPWLAPWPDGRSWAFVMTHDVETSAGYRRLDRVLEVERRTGVRSAWYFVPERDYHVEVERVHGLIERGCEVGVHGLRHDGRDLAPGSFWSRRSAIRGYAKRWGATGFRSPATHRSWDLMPHLGFDYDSSYCDTAPYEPQSGGSCSWLPYFIGDLVELPITIPQDHTLFELLDHRDESLWMQKASFLKEQGGLALLLTHPDYLHEGERLDAYARFLDAFAGDESAWKALPREVSGWWRRRAASSIERDGDGWTVVGPAAGEARIVFGADGR